LSIYKECDIRGIYEKELSRDDAYYIGRAVGTILFEKKVVLCGDIRVSTPVLKEQLKKGLLASGADIVDIGTMPTPVFYFAKQFLKADGGVMVTASHNPAEYNGFKISIGEMPISPDDIANIEKAVSDKSFSNGRGREESADIEEKYIEYVKNKIEANSLKVVIDAGNGSASLIAPKMFREFGSDVVELFCSYDGTFPNRDANPSDHRNLLALQNKVIEEKADLGIAFDGDGDRVVFVDEQGKVALGEKSLCIFIEHYLKNKPASVVYDLKSSLIVKQRIEDFGGEPIMERSGHAFIKNTFLKNGSVLAGEVSGHYFFGELGHDDGIYAALKMAEIITKKKESFSKTLGRIRNTLISPDIRLHLEYSRRDALLDKIKDMGKDYNLSFLDGVRVEYPFGWILVRKSVTEESITIRIEAEDEKGRDEIISKLLKAAPELIGKHSLF